MASDNRFTYPGSPYENEDLIAFARVSPGIQVDWYSYSPTDSVWVPETLLSKLAALAPGALHGLDIYEQHRLGEAQIRILLKELPEGESGSVGECIALVRGLALSCVASGDELLIEGP